MSTLISVPKPQVRSSVASLWTSHEQMATAILEHTAETLRYEGATGGALCSATSLSSLGLSSLKIRGAGDSEGSRCTTDVVNYRKWKGTAGKSVSGWKHLKLISCISSVTKMIAESRQAQIIIWIISEVVQPVSYSIMLSESGFFNTFHFLSRIPNIF